MKKVVVMRTFSVLLCGIAGAVLGWLIGYANYFFTEVLPFRNASDGERVFHAVDGGVAIAILTLYLLMPIGGVVGALAGAYLTTKRVNKFAEVGQ